jgi:hypothetical protein
VFNDRLNFRPDRGITGVMQLDQYRHFLFILQTQLWAAVQFWLFFGADR